MEPSRKPRTLLVLVALLALLVIFLALVLMGALRLGGAGPGQATLDYLRGSPYTSMFVEVDYVQGALPAPGTLNLLRNRIDTYTDKTSFEVTTDTAFPAGDGAYDLGEIRGYEQRYRNRHTGGTTAVMYVLYLDGTYTEAPDVLGVAYGATSIAVFKERIQAAEPGGPIPPFLAEDIENSVVIHEFGHLLGLVNLVYESRLGYEDTAHPGHSSNQSCVMYWAIEGFSVGGVFVNAPPTDFGSEAREDLAKLRSGEYQVGPSRSAPIPALGVVTIPIVYDVRSRVGLGRIMSGGRGVSQCPAHPEWDPSPR